MRRIISVLAVAALMAVMMVAMAAPAFAANPHFGCKPGSEGFKNSGHTCRHK